MKKIKYSFVRAVVNRGSEENPQLENILADKVIYCPDDAALERNLSVAAAEAHDGQYTIEDDGVTETISLSDADRLEKLEAAVNQLPELIKNAIAMALTGKE